MAVREVYSHPVYLRYKASLCTYATFFLILAFLFTVIAPFLIVFWSEGFWLKHDFYIEQPIVRFRHQMLLLVDTEDEASYFAWSTYPNFNQLQQQHLRVPLVKTREEDMNRDGKTDMLHFSILLPVLETENIRGVKLMLFFDYNLYRFSTLKMQSMAYIHHESSVSGAEFIADGELRLRLKSPLSHSAVDSRYNFSVIKSESIFMSDYQLSKIFTDYMTRNVSTYFECHYPVWVRGPCSTGSFLIRGTVRYPEELIGFVPGLLQVLKMAWVQYFSVLVIFVYLMAKVKTFVFRNQLINTLVERPFILKNHQL